MMTTVELGLRHSTSPVQAKSIAQSQAIPARFIEHVLSGLKQAGLVTSQRGAQGGYILSKEPGEISLAEIVKAMNGTTRQTLNGSINGHPKNAHEELLSDIFDRLHHAELAILRSISLQSLVDQYQDLEDKRALMYHI
ncbi:MAG: Rrf2 family transcriptional regulator [Nitrospira sp.]|nr:Rrf2 family transcriptional regulator [Nitrospira sp.]